MTESKTFKRSCRECGWNGTYTFAKRADYAKRIHSCERHLAKAESRSRRLARLAAVDRTPKPCLHKFAEHAHGTHSCYVLDVCRCVPCSNANSAYESNRGRQKAYGRQDYIDAEPSRAHIRSLMAQGMGLKRIVLVSDLSQGQLWKLLYGKKRPDGSRVPSQRVRRDTERRILAVKLNLAGGAKVDFSGGRRRLQALVCLGYSVNSLGQRLGVNTQNMHTMMHHQSAITARTAKAIADLYDQLSMHPNDPSEPHAKAAATRARNYAASFGWLPPLAWDDDTIDNPMMEPALVADARLRRDVPIDEIAIQRRFDGDRSVKLTRNEKVELARRWRAAGRSHNEWADVTGYTQYGRYFEPEAA